MKQVKTKQRLESILPFLHNPSDNVSNNPINMTETNNPLHPQNKTNITNNSHKVFNNKKRIQVIQQIKKQTKTKFKNLKKNIRFSKQKHMQTKKTF